MDDDTIKDAAEYANVATRWNSLPWSAIQAAFLAGAKREREKWEAEQSAILRGADVVREDPIINRNQAEQG